MTRPGHPSLLRRRAPGRLAAALALLGQIALSAVVGYLVPTSVPTILGTAVPIRHAGTTGSDSPADRSHRDSDCALCPLCLALATPAALLVPAPTPPAPSAVVVQRAAPLPPARAPPAAAVFAATYPTGPPTLA